MATPTLAPTPTQSSGTPGSLFQATAGSSSAPDPTAPLRPYVAAAASNLGGPNHGTLHPGPALLTPVTSAPAQVAFGPPPNTIIGHPVAVPMNHPISYSTSAAAFLPQQHATPHPASSATLLAPSSPLPTFAAAQQHASQQRTSAAARHRSVTGLRSQSHRGAGGSALAVGTTIPVIAILYPIAPGFQHDGSTFGGETVLHQTRRAAFRERAAQLSLAISLQVSRDTDTLLLVQQHVRHALETGPAQLCFEGLDNLLASATTNYDRLPFQVMSSCRRGFVRKDGNVYHKPFPGPLSENEMMMINYISHRELAHPRRIYWENNTLLIYLMSKVPVEGLIPWFNDGAFHHCLMARLTSGLTTDQHSEGLPGYQPHHGHTQPWHEPGGDLTSDSENEEEDDSVIAPDISTNFAFPTTSSSSSVLHVTPAAHTSIPSGSRTSSTSRSAASSSSASSSSTLASGSSSVSPALRFPSAAMNSPASHFLDSGASVMSQLSFPPAYLTPLPPQDDLLSPLTHPILGLDDQGPTELQSPLLPVSNAEATLHVNEETAEFLSAMSEYPSHEPFSKRVSSNTHRLHYSGNIPMTRVRWGWKFLEDAERGSQPQAPLHIRGEDFHSEIIPTLKTHMLTAIRTSNASRIFQANFTIATMSSEGERIAQGEGLIREAITQIYEDLGRQCQPYMHTTPAGYKVIHSDEILLSPKIREALKLFGLAQAMHLVWAHAAAPFTSPPYLQLLLHGGDLAAITRELLARWEPTTLDILNLWANLGPAGTHLNEPIKSTLQEIFPSVQVECLPSVRTPQQHNQIWHMILQVLSTGGLHMSPHHQAFESGFSLPLANGWTMGAHCYRSSTSDFVNDLCGHHIKSADDVLSQISFTFSPPGREQDVTAALQDASGDPWMTFSSLLKEFLCGTGPVSEALLRAYIQDGRISYSGDLAELDDPGYRARLFCRAVCGSLSLPAQIQVIFDSGRSLASQHGEVFIRTCLSQVSLPTRAIVDCFKQDHLLESEGQGLDSAHKTFEFWLLRNLMNSLGSYGTT
ncbi:hypothetical protein M407DRAFT_33733 [Tulasnella calospora MUT 4182]|uniref:HECT domain-containing protein n=1 Tax=Tulasnella calospora MUT 4182 TaxID=1051891 RepID=A0A0C3PQ16_9AGAM|nr:hypothetical protein M407DRAFT_33733 [Tulasnella calospora MUT 4182]